MNKNDHAHDLVDKLLEIAADQYIAEDSAKLDEFKKPPANRPNVSARVLAEINNAREAAPAPPKWRRRVQRIAAVFVVLAVSLTLLMQIEAVRLAVIGPPKDDDFLQVDLRYDESALVDMGVQYLPRWMPDGFVYGHTEVYPAADAPPQQILITFSSDTRSIHFDWYSGDMTNGIDATAEVIYVDGNRALYKQRGDTATMIMELEDGHVLVDGPVEILDIDTATSIMAQVEKIQ